MTAAPPAVSFLFAEVLLFWLAANYLFSADPIRNSHRERLPRRDTKRLSWFALRAALAAALTAAAAGWGQGAVLACVTLAGCFLLPVARWQWVPSRYGAELEILANSGFAALAGFLIAHFHLQARWRPPHLPVPDNLLPAYVASAALLIFVVRGGTCVVRGVLDRAGTMPPPEPGKSAGLAAGRGLDLKRGLPIDTIELNHGRLIGNIERLILVLFVANGQYTALAFFFAAKGLIRSRDVERRAWADYLILGSLTSFLVAVVIGLLIQALFRGATP